jgi:hypothetical protein
MTARTILPLPLVLCAFASGCGSSPASQAGAQPEQDPSVVAASSQTQSAIGVSEWIVSAYDAHTDVVLGYTGAGQRVMVLVASASPTSDGQVAVDVKLSGSRGSGEFQATLPPSGSQTQASSITIHVTSDTLAASATAMQAVRRAVADLTGQTGASGTGTTLSAFAPLHLADGTSLSPGGEGSLSSGGGGSLTQYKECAIYSAKAVIEIAGGILSVVAGCGLLGGETGGVACAGAALGGVDLAWTGVENAGNAVTSCSQAFGSSSSPNVSCGGGPSSCSYVDPCAGTGVPCGSAALPPGGS